MVEYYINNKCNCIIDNNQTNEFHDQVMCKKELHHGSSSNPTVFNKEDIPCTSTSNTSPIHSPTLSTTTTSNNNNNNVISPTSPDQRLSLSFITNNNNQNNNQNNNNQNNNNQKNNNNTQNNNNNQKNNNNNQNNICRNVSTNCINFKVIDQLSTPPCIPSKNNSTTTTTTTTTDATTIINDNTDIISSSSSTTTSTLTPTFQSYRQVDQNFSINQLPTLVIKNILDYVHGGKFPGYHAVVAKSVSHSRNRHLHTIKLRYCQLEDEGADMMSRSLFNNTYIKSIDINGNNIQSKGCDSLAKLIQQNRVIETLCLGNNSIDNVGAAILANAIKQNTTLKMLDLENNNINYFGAFPLLEALKVNTTLRDLNLYIVNIPTRNLRFFLNGTIGHIGDSKQRLIELVLILDRIVLFTGQRSIILFLQQHNNNNLNNFIGEEENDILIPKVTITKKKEGIEWDKKTLSLLIIGVLTVLYVIAELGSALYTGSLALLSDGFHNLTDAVSLYVAWWALKAKKQGNDRAEILGGLLNGSFLVSMSLYVALEAIPRLVHPEPIEGGTIFMSVAGAGLAINTIGTIVFACTGMEHAHSHGPGGGHSHGGEKKEKKKEKHGHSHGGDGEKKEKKEKHGHSHGDGEKKEKKEKHGHSHGGDHGHAHNDGNGANADHDHHDHSDEHHGHSHGGEKKKEKHGHSHGEGEKKEKHGHSHGGEKKKEKKGGHGHGGESKTCMGMDLNMFGVFIHFLGDAISSLFVLVTGAILHFFQGHHWTLYVDPLSSLIIVAMTLASAIPLVIKCSKVLLEPTPTTDSHDDHDSHDHDSHP
ncbi:putative zinc transporter [Cavenderia fasciculata]|uniref:Zinc transporter n=1 Tax=Cavenderia fasciculata TaxID=261658 RepID=F4PLY9_CACFS|nr:putative zinc transporter [Cavenderia fasciculata]EGG23543.1 putative zinc transporter [Cavenderia fasciculata]|eukprot:XP_004361394.1 putative zinc transporter [Cavenderia fasciculata]